jgi:hypothetical protein
MDISNAHCDLVPWRTWINEFIHGEYFEWQTQCPCGSRTPCTKYFCIQCKVGHLCLKTDFRPGCDHEGHPYLQVRKVTFRNAIPCKDIEKFQMDTHGIQMFDFNNDSVYFLRSINRPNIEMQRCKVCNSSIKTANGDAGAKYCSLECKLSTRDASTSRTSYVNSCWIEIKRMLGNLMLR